MDVVGELTETSWRAFLELSPDAKHAVAGATEIAVEMGHASVETEHLLLGLMESPDETVAATLREVDLTAGAVRELTRPRIAPGPSTPNGGVPISTELTETLDAGSRVAFAMGSDLICPGHILLALVALRNDCGACQVIDQLGIDLRVIHLDVKQRLYQPPTSTDKLPMVRTRTGYLRHKQ